MGRIVAEIDDELERQFRLEVARRGGKKGELSNTLEEVLSLWVEQSNFDEFTIEFIAHCREKSTDKEKFDQIVEHIGNDVTKLLRYIAQCESIQRRMKNKRRQK
jgi:CRISPR/Cas system CMR-associated protein Cmr5 small subunit